MKTQTTVKSKSVRKSKSAVAPIVAPQAPDYASMFPYALLLLDSLAGLLGMTIQRFYVRAKAYHDVQKTTFPRADYVGAPLLSADDARAKLADIGARNASIGNAHTWSRRLYDEMRVQVANPEAREFFAKYATDAIARADASKVKA